MRGSIVPKLAGWSKLKKVVGRGALLLASATFLRKLLNHHRNREKVKFYDQVLTSCVKNMRDAAAELQSWGRLLIEEHDATIHVRYLRSRTRVRAGYRTRDHEGGQFGYTWGGAEVGAALYAEHSTHCLHTVLHTLYTVHASAPCCRTTFHVPTKIIADFHYVLVSKLLEKIPGRLDRN